MEQGQIDHKPEGGGCPQQGSLAQWQSGCPVEWADIIFCSHCMLDVVWLCLNSHVGNLRRLVYFLALVSLEWDVVGGQKRPSLSGSGSGQAVVTGSGGLWGSMGHLVSWPHTRRVWLHGCVSFRKIH